MSEKYRFNHVNDTANSIFASWNSFPAESVGFIPFFDNLKNLIQDRVILAFFEEKETELNLLFHTFQDPYFKNHLDARVVAFVNQDKHQAIQIDHNTVLFVMGFNFIDDKDGLKISIIPIDKALYSELKDLIAVIKAEYVELLPLVATFLRNAAIDERIRYRQPIRQLISQDMSDSEKNEYLNEIRELISDCITDVEDSPLVKAKIDQENAIANLFAVVAYPAVGKRCQVFNYTAQILLTKRQIDSITAWSKDSSFISAVETSLSQNSRSIADTPFCTGFVEYSGTAGAERDSAGLAADSLRQDREQNLYSAITQTADHNNEVVNYIPIFLNGCPWVVFFTLAKREADSFKYWRHNYFMYRDIISKVGNSIRIKAKSKFLEIAARIIENTVATNPDVDSYLSEVNRKFRNLSCFFPFPLPSLVAKNDGLNSSFFLNNVEFATSTISNDFWIPYLGYDNIEARKILEKCQEVLANVLNQKETENKKQELSIAAYGSAHFYGNWLGIIRSALVSLTRNLRVLYPEMKANEIYARVHESLRDLYDANKGMRDVTKIVDLLAKRNILQESHSPLMILEDDDRFSTKDEIIINDVISSILLLKKITDYEPLECDLQVPPFLAKNRRPHRLFYENIFLEILTNYENKNIGTLTVKELTLDNAPIGISFSNPYACSKGEKGTNGCKEVNRRVFKGAILYCHLFLKEYGLGKILYRTECTENVGIFEFQVILNHIEYGTKKNQNLIG